MQTCRKVGSLLLVLVFVVSMLTAIPVLAADYASITLETTETGLTIGSTGTAIVHGVDSEGTKTKLTTGVTYGTTSGNGVITVNSSTGQITPVNEGIATLTATYQGLTASTSIVVGATTSQLQYETGDEANATFAVNYPQSGQDNMKFTPDANDIPKDNIGVAAGTKKFSDKDAEGTKAYQDRYRWTDTTSISTAQARKGSSSLGLDRIDLSAKQTIWDAKSALLTDPEKTLLNGKWACLDLKGIDFKANNDKGILEFWFYDTGENLALIWLSTKNGTATRGHFRVDSTGYYFNKDGASRPETTKNIIPRSQGWHQFVLDYSSSDRYAMYIDGKLMWDLQQKDASAVLSNGVLNTGFLGIRIDRTLSNTNANKHELWIDSIAVYDVAVSRPVAPVVSNVTVSGKAIEEQTLASDFTYFDANGDLKTGQNYRWQVSANGTDGWTDISGATSSTYTLAAGDVGKYVRVGVIATNGAAEQTASVEAFSDAFGPVVKKPNTSEQIFTSLDISHTKNLYLKADEASKVVISGTSVNGEYDLADYDQVTYFIDDPYTASVSADGTITPRDAGYAVLTATVKNSDGTSASASLLITVAEARNTMNFEGYTIPSPDVNTHMQLSTDIVRSGATSMKYQKAPSTATAAKWGLDQYGGYGTSYTVEEGWFYDNGAKDGSAVASIYFQSIDRDSTGNLPIVVASTVGILDGAIDYYKINNPAQARANRGPGGVNWTGTADAGKGYLGDKTGSFVTDGQAGMPLIKRTKGWHQVTMVVDRGATPAANIATDQGSITYYIDGIKVFTEKYVPDGINAVRGVGANSPNFAIYDDLSHAQIANNPRPPLASNLTITGTAMATKSVTVTADVTDKNGDPVAATTYQWEVSANGTTGWANATGSGATTATYTFAASDAGKYFRAKVTPHSTVAPTDGDPAYSNVIGPVSDEKTAPWVVAGSFSITGTPSIGNTLTANYTYAKDPVKGDLEGETQFVWERSATSGGTYEVIADATTKTYNPGAADAGKFVRVKITPVDKNGLAGPTVITAPVQVSTEVQYFVATNGNDSNTGSISEPFATITKARDVIRTAIAAGLGEGSIVVNIRGGEYPVTSTITFTAADSGTEQCPIIYRAYNGEKVTFSGGTVIPASKISKVTDSDKDAYGNKILDRIKDPVAKSKLVKIDLSDYAGEIPKLSEGWSYEFVTPWSKSVIPVDVYVNGSALEPARWPNDEEDTAMFNPTSVVGAAVIDGKRSNASPVTINYPDPNDETKDWNQQAIADDLMIGGYFGYHWYMNTHKVGSMDTTTKQLKTLGGTAVDPAKNLAYYLYNILEAIDVPGESYIDRTKKIAYYYPNSDLENAEIQVAGFDSNLLSADGLKNVTFQGLDFEYNRNVAVNMRNLENVTWDNCDVGHIANNGMNASGTNVTIKNSHIFDTGKNGLTIGGGDRKTLTPSNNLITNNVFHDQGRVQKTYVPAIQISGCVGATISHNEIFNNNHEAIAYGSSNDIIIEYNDLHNVVTTSGDMGAIYCGRNVTEMGYVIRYNKIAHVGSKYSEGWSQSIFFDDGNSGAEIYGNIFYRGTLTMDKGANTGKSFAVKTNGGQFFHVYNNIFIDMPSALQFQSWTTANIGTSSQQARYIAYNFDYTLAKSGDTITLAKTAAHGNASSQWLKFTQVNFNDGIWKQHYAGTIWAPIFDIFTEANRQEMENAFANNNPAAALALVERIAPAKQNFFRDNVAVQIANPQITVNSTNETKGTNYANANTTTASGAPLFVDYAKENFQLSAAGLAEVQKTLPNFPNVDTSKIGPSTSVDGSRPVASNATLTGAFTPGGKAKVYYTYSDADQHKEVGTKYQWYVSTAVDGTYELMRGYSSNEITVPASIAGKFLKCVVTPKDVRQLPGEKVETAPVQIGNGNFDVDPTPLIELLDEIDSFLEGIVIGEEDGNYPQAAIDTFEAMITEAEGVVNTAKYQYQIDDMVKKLNTAWEVAKTTKIEKMEFMSIRGMLNEGAESWTSYNGTGALKLENGVMTIPGGSAFAYNPANKGLADKTFKNKIFTFKMKLEKMDPQATPAINNSVCFRAKNVGLLWAGGNLGYLWWMKADKNEAQYFSPNILREFGAPFIAFDKEYEISVGVYDTAGGAVKWVLYVDGNLVYETIYEGPNNQYGESGYFMMGSAAGINMIIKEVPTVYTALNEALADAEAVRATAVQGDAYGEYSRQAIDAFDAAIAKAKEVANDTNAVQRSVDAAVSSIEAATNSFKAAAVSTMDVMENGNATIDYDISQAQFTVSPPVTSFVLNMDATKKQPAYTFTYKATGGDVTVAIPYESTLSASGWDGTFDLPIAGTTPSGTISTGENFMAVAMGEPGKVITSSEIVRIVLPGQKEKMLAYKTADGKYATIKKNDNLSADTMDAAEMALASKDVVKLNVGNDMVIYTKILTEFVAYDFKSIDNTPTPTGTTPTPTSNPGPSQPIGGGSTGGAGKPTPAPTTSKFTDIVGHWAEADINEMAAKGIVKGITETTFDPDRSITRAEFAALVARALKISADETSSMFEDIDPNSWYAKDVAAAAKAGLIVGSDGYFRPADLITREEMAVVIMKAYYNLGFKKVGNQLDQFADKDDISEWAQGSVGEAVSAGLITGVTQTTFAPKENATRAQVASLLKRLLTK